MENSKKTYWLILYLILAILANTISSNLISIYYPSLPEAPDTFLRFVDGNWGILMKISEIIIVICIITFILYLSKSKESLNKSLFIVATFQLFRAILMPLTPLKTIASHSFLSSFITFQEGLFPSGHTALPFLFFLLTYKKSKLSYFYLISTVFVGFSLLLAKQHYTIDIIATIFIAYSIKVFTERNIKCF